MGALHALCLLVLVSSCLGDEEKLQVKTKYGDVKGVEIEAASGKHIHAFFGIPYAEPPVGELRFTEPRPPKKWDDVRDASQFGPDCPQSDRRLKRKFNSTHPMSEDCLYLNIYGLTEDHGDHDHEDHDHEDHEDHDHEDHGHEDHDHKDHDHGDHEDHDHEDHGHKDHDHGDHEDHDHEDHDHEDHDHLHPVVVVFPFSSYGQGSVREFDGTALAEKGTIVVTVSYRVGVFGFLSTDDEEALGNYALLDQIEALKWVQDNIDRFGGDPKRVTIMGSGAAGNMVALHLMSPYSEGLFHRAIMSCGSMVSPSAVLLPPYKAVDFATELADKLGCSTESTKEIVSCLREKTVDELIKTRVSATPMFGESVYTPVIDGPGGVIAASPRKMIESNQFSKVPIMVGTLDNYQAYRLARHKGIEFGLSSDMRDQLLKAFTLRYPEKPRSFILDILNFEYTDFKRLHDPAANRDSVIKASTDYVVNAPMVFQAAAHAAAGGPVWMYEFHHVSKNDPRPKWRGGDLLDDFALVFGQKMKYSDERFELDENDKEVQDMILNAVRDFARTGDPTPGEAPDAWKWPRYQGDTQPYLEIRTPEETKVGNFFRAKKTALWTYYIPKLLYDAAEEGEKDNVNPFGGASPSSAYWSLRKAFG